MNISWVFEDEEGKVAEVGGRDNAPTVVIRGLGTYLKYKEIVYFPAADTKQAYYKKIDAHGTIDHKSGIIVREHID